MNKKSALLILPVILFGTISCNTLKEPDIDVCVITDAETAYCIPQHGNRPEFELKLKECIGCFMVSPDGYGEIKKHHDELHKRLKDKDQ